ncbi:hypothetical protein GGI11_009034, partial [Coemansia sp. RSA 2049]
ASIASAAGDCVSVPWIHAGYFERHHPNQTACHGRDVVAGSAAEPGADGWRWRGDGNAHIPGGVSME